MAKRRVANFRWRDALGLIPWLVVAAIVTFETTKAKWFEPLTPSDRALFWADAVTSLATTGLVLIAAISALVAYNQYREYVRGERVKATTDLLQEWSSDDLQQLMGFIDTCLQDWTYAPQHNREFARRLYLLVNETKVEKRPNETREDWRERKRLTLERRDRVSGGIETIALLAARTWNLLHGEIIDEEVLLNQIDFDVISTYFELEDVLAIRQVEDEQLYSEFTQLVRAAQRHYRRRQNREVVDDFVEATFEDLPFEDDEFEHYMSKVVAREAAFWRDDEAEDASGER